MSLGYQMSIDHPIGDLAPLGLSSHNLPALGVLLAGLALLLVLLFVIKLLGERREQRRGKDLVKGLSTNIQSLELKFSAAIEDFRRRGKDKDPITAPWYIMVGEPGAGKTEAIRNSGISLVRGMNDIDAGIGGTLNVDWWVAEDAILLDTAGRLMFEKTPDGKHSEWLEVLRLLKKARPRCPINGMILAIPCNHLFNASEKEVRKKADKIAAEFDRVQKELEVRFPVYVILTKADVLPGFRKFFANLKGENSAHQILGWSNPDNLDNNFRPELVEQHLDAVGDRLRALRLSFIMDPRPVEPKGVRRADQLDALFAFPSSLRAIAPNLSIYLKTVFTPNTWLASPLFLRGIYFTSAMQDGDELDSDLAAKLGLSAGKQDKTRIWREDKTYFLKEPIEAKAFAEKGLVTSSANVSRSLRLRQFALGSSIIAACFLVVLWSIFGLKSMQDGVGVQADFIDGFKKLPNQKLVDVDTESGLAKYQGKNSVTAIPNCQTLEDVQVKNLELMQSEIKVPPVYKIWSKLSGDPTDLSRQYHAQNFEECVLKPYLQAMTTETDELKDGSKSAKFSETLRVLRVKRVVAALQVLVNLNNRIQSSGGSTSFDLKPLAIMLNPQVESTAAPLDISALLLQPKPLLSVPARNELAATIPNCARTITDALDQQVGMLQEFRRQLSECDEAELTVINDFKKAAVTNSSSVVKTSIDGSKEKIKTDLRLLKLKENSVADFLKADQQAQAILEFDMKGLLSDISDECDAVDALSVPSTTSKLQEIHNNLNKLKSNSDLPESIISVEADVAGSNQPGQRIEGWGVDKRIKYYDHLLENGENPANPAATDKETIGSLVDRLNKASSLPGATASEFATLEDRDGAKDAFDKVARLLNTAKMIEAYQWILGKEAALDCAASISIASRNPELASSPGLTTDTDVSSQFDRQYDPKAAAEFLQKYDEISNTAGPALRIYDVPAASRLLDQVRKNREQYVTQYINYWEGQGKITNLFKVESNANSWDAFCEEATTFDNMCVRMQSLFDKAGLALDKPFIDWSDPSIASLKEARGTIDEGRHYLDTQRLQQTQLSNWVQLGNRRLNLDESRAEIGKSTTKVLANLYWLDPADGSVVQRFWSDRFKHGFELLAQASQDAYAHDKTALKQSEDKFPLNMEKAAEEMKETDYETFKANLSHLRPPVAVPDAYDLPGDLSAFRHKIVCDDSPDDGWIRNLKEKINWVDSVTNCEINILSPTDSQNAFPELNMMQSRSVNGIYQWMRKIDAGNNLSPGKSTFEGGKSIKIELDKDYNQTFRFWVNKDSEDIGGPYIELKIDKPWTILTLIRENERSFSAREGKRKLLLKINTEDNDPKGHTQAFIYTEIKFNADCPTDLKASPAK